jgi:hypothetical protein
MGNDSLPSALLLGLTLKEGNTANTIALPTGSFLLYTCEREFSHNMWSLTAHMWSLTAHIAWLWLWLWLWLRLLNPLEFLQLNDCANRFAGQFAAPFRITCARQRFPR